MAGLSACGKTGGNGEDFDGTNFNGDETTTGKIEITVTQGNRIPVGGTSGVAVFASDADGKPIQYVRVVCDTEAELVILEPTTGYELTGEFGTMSALIGCNQEGSYKLGCRLANAGGIRKFVDIVCFGSAPDDFSGFDGAGGGLGGGRVDPADATSDDDA